MIPVGIRGPRVTTKQRNTARDAHFLDGNVDREGPATAMRWRYLEPMEIVTRVGSTVYRDALPAMKYARVWAGSIAATVAANILVMDHTASDWVIFTIATQGAGPCTVMAARSADFDAITTPNTCGIHLSWNGVRTWRRWIDYGAALPPVAHLVLLSGGFSSDSFDSPDNPNSDAYVTDNPTPVPYIGADANLSLNEDWYMHLLSQQRIAMNASNSVLGISPPGEAWYLPNALRVGTQVVFPTLLSGATDTRCLGVAWGQGLWWALIEQFTRVYFAPDRQFYASDRGVFIVTSTGIDAVDPSTWTLYRTIQADGGTGQGYLNYSVDAYGLPFSIKGVFDSNSVLTSIQFDPFLYRFSDRSTLSFTQITVAIPGGVPGSHDWYANKNGTITADSGDGKYCTVNIGANPDVWQSNAGYFIGNPTNSDKWYTRYNPPAGFYFTNGNGVTPIAPANLGATVTLVTPTTATTPDGSIGGVVSNDTYLDTLATAGLSCAALPSWNNPLVFMLLEYVTSNQGGSDYRLCGIFPMPAGAQATNDFDVNKTQWWIGMDEFAVALGTRYSVLQINDHGKTIASVSGYPNVDPHAYWRLSPTIRTVLYALNLPTPTVLGVGVGGTCLLAPNGFGDNFQYLVGTSTTHTLSPLLQSNGWNTDGYVPVRFNGIGVVYFDGLESDGTPIQCIIDQAGLIDTTYTWCAGCDDGSTGLYGIDSATGNLYRRAGVSGTSWTLVLAGVCAVGDTVLLLQVVVVDSTSIQCVHGQFGAVQLTTVKAGVKTDSSPINFGTSALNASWTAGSYPTNINGDDCDFTVAATI